MKIHTVLGGFLMGLLLMSCHQAKNEDQFTEQDINLIPKPVSLELDNGYFEFNQQTKFIISEDFQAELVTFLTDQFKTVSNWELAFSYKAPEQNYLEFIIDPSLEDEAYKIDIQSNRIQVLSSSDSGFLYGMQTIRQLLPPTIESATKASDPNYRIPNCKIEDYPRFKYRGLMLDVTRHFFELDFLKKTVDRLSMLKMNVLHLHLVDDQGWRIEIKKYPKLTSVGAWRVDQEDRHWNDREVTSAADKGTYGGYYTQEELKDLVAYAASKNVEIIPEIEMPAHVSSAIAAYPELSCLEEPIGVPSGGLWPITDIYCAGKDQTFDFLEDVLDEVMAIFPSKYIHVGGDEATKTNWEICPHCNKRMSNQGLESVEELQSYFIKRMERYINSKGKRLIGWDEILEGGIAPEATVMSWRGVKGGVEAAEQGHDVIMTPGTHCYFDHYQGDQDQEPLAIGGYTPLSKVYQFDPVVSTMSPEEASHVLGGQANLWSEYITTESHSEYMTYPRLAAFSETLWSTKLSRDWNDFSRRIESFFKRLDLMGVNYAKSAYNIISQEEFNETTNEVNVVLKNEFPESDIRYVFNDQDLSTDGIQYTDTIVLNKSTVINYLLYRNGNPYGAPMKTKVEFHKAVGKSISFKEPYHKNYPGKYHNELINVLRGSKNFHDGNWQAWINADMEAVIDLEELTEVNQVVIGALKHSGAGVYYPSIIRVSTSKNGTDFNQVGELLHQEDRHLIVDLRAFDFNFEKHQARYIKVEAINSKPKGRWLFVDEIAVY